MIDLKAIHDHTPVFALAKIAREAAEKAKGDPLEAATLAAVGGLVLAHLPGDASNRRDIVVCALEQLKDDAEQLQEVIHKMSKSALTEVRKEMEK